MTGAKVSVLLPVYNCEDYVVQAIDSILQQSHRNLEVLVADDASTDSSRTIISAYNDERIVFLHNASNLGYLKTINNLMQHSTGDYITFQDADDWSHPDRIKLQLECLARERLHVCGTAIHNTSSDGKVIGRNVYPRSSGEIASNALAGLSAVCYATVMFSRDVYRDVGGYREFFRYGGEDVDWFLRIIERYDCRNLAKPLYYYRFYPDSITGSVNILRQVASLRIAREMSVQRSQGQADYLERGAPAEAEMRYEQILRSLEENPFAESVFRFNQLLRKRAHRTALAVLRDIVQQPGPPLARITVVLGCLMKLLLGVDRYRKLFKPPGRVAESS
jgi:glycosyltransferase involved in cell wall biosynthesis